MELIPSIILWITLFIMLVGLTSLIIPILPSLIIMWLAALGYGLAHGFGKLGVIVMVLITILMIGGSVIDNVLMGAGARKGGASWKAILIALLAGLLGTLAFPPFGGFVAAPMAILLFEYARLRDWQKAWHALIGLATGLGASIVVRFLIGLVIFALWIFWVWKSQGF